VIQPKKRKPNLSKDELLATLRQQYNDGMSKFQGHLSANRPARRDKMMMRQTPKKIWLSELRKRITDLETSSK